MICCDKQTVVDKAVGSHIPTCLLNNMNFAYGANSSGNQLPCLREKQGFHPLSISARTLKTTVCFSNSLIEGWLSKGFRVVETLFKGFF